MKLLKCFLIVCLLSLASCPMAVEGPYTQVQIYNQTLEKIKIVSNTGLFGLEREHTTININEDSILSLPTNITISAKGDATGTYYSSRSFSEWPLTQTWIVNK